MNATAIESYAVTCSFCDGRGPMRGDAKDAEVAAMSAGWLGIRNKAICPACVGLFVRDLPKPTKDGIIVDRMGDMPKPCPAHGELRVILPGLRGQVVDVALVKGDNAITVGRAVLDAIHANRKDRP